MASYAGSNEVLTCDGCLWLSAEKESRFCNAFHTVGPREIKPVNGEHVRPFHCPIHGFRILLGGERHEVCVVSSWS